MSGSCCPSRASRSSSGTSPHPSQPFQTTGGENDDYETFVTYLADWNGLGPSVKALGDIRTRFHLGERSVHFKGRDNIRQAALQEWVAAYGGSRKDAGRVIGKSGDEGIDGLINEDRLGLDVVYVQAKRWSRTVGRPEIQAFAGSLEGKRARKGVFITTSDFSREPPSTCSTSKRKLSSWTAAPWTLLMMDHGVGVSEVASYC